jgi:type IV secretory pathway TrbF-like protein
MMWLKKTEQKEKKEAPEQLRYSRYYEHDGALRSYANRAMLLAFITVPTALVAITLAAYVRLQPPTVIRVDSSGQATVLGQRTAATGQTVTVAQGVNAAPDELEKKGFVRLFLDRYLNFSPDAVNRNWADALNMMTANLRRASLNAMEKDNTVGRVQDEQITSVFHLRSIEPAKDDPLSFIAFGVKEVHHVRDHQEATDKLVGEFHIRLITEGRSESNPSGLLIAEYGERLIEGERRDALLENSALSPSK